MKTQPTGIRVEDFLKDVGEKRRQEAHILIDMMRGISREKPYMWGPSIIGFGTQHYKYDTGREGNMPQLAFSPRKASITIYFSEGFDRYASLLQRLGKHKRSVSCLYIPALADVETTVLRKILEASFMLAKKQPVKRTSVAEYIASIPPASRPKFDELRQLVKNKLPHAEEVLSYGIVGYKVDAKRARVFISGWKDHVAMYPVPKNDKLQAQLAPYIKGKGTLWFGLEEPLPSSLIEKAVLHLGT